MDRGRSRDHTAGGRTNNMFGPPGSDDDDLYSGYNDYPTALTTEDLEFDENFQNTARTIENRRPTAMGVRGRTPGTAMSMATVGKVARLGTAAGFSRQPTAGGNRAGLISRGGIGTARPMTGANDPGGINRPMTAVRGAGYTGSGKNPKVFDPLNQGVKSATPSIEIKIEDTPEEKIKQLEEKINDLIEQSVLAGCKKEHKKALELAKEASNKEKSLMRLKEQAGLNEGHDWDITFSVLFNLASQYEACEMYTEAMSTYHAISKNKFLAHGAKVKINMGNIYVKQNNPTKAIKMYRMAMDQLNQTNRDLRLKLMHNMGIVFLRINSPVDAAGCFEYIMTEKPSFKTGLHSVVANFMAGDAEKMKRSFELLLEVPVETEDDDEKYAAISDDPVSQLLVEVLKNDKLRKLEKERKLYAERCVLSAARLIAPLVESSFADGYNWVTETIKSSKHAALAHALEISKALVFLKQRELAEATEILKSFEKKETKVATAAATNLSFMFFLQGDLEQAEKYGEVAKSADFYNACAYVNLGNCMYARQDYERAKEFYNEAIATDSSCIEALYNLGLSNQHLQFYEEAMECFHKVHSLCRNHPHVTFQLGRTHELMGEADIAVEWYLKALALVPTDPGILKKLGYMAEMEGDRQQAYQYYYDCYRHDPSDLEAIEWIGSYLNEVQLHDRAITFFSRAMLLQPNEIRWPMLIAACHRRTGNYTQAIETYSKVYKENPDNLPALQALARLTADMGLKEADYYAEELKKLEKQMENRMSAGRSGRFGPPSRLGTARAGPSRGGHEIDSDRYDMNGSSPSPAGMFQMPRAETAAERREMYGMSRPSDDTSMSYDDEELGQSYAPSQTSFRGSQRVPASARRIVEEDEDIFADEDLPQEFLPF